MSSKLVVQRGHVPRTTGATGAPGEQAMAIRNAAEIVAIAKDLPDVTPAIIDADPPNTAYAGDRFISLHGDGSVNTERREASVGYRNEPGRALATRWKSLYEQGGWSYGFMRDNYTTNLGRYYGTGQAVSADNPHAIIVEHGFMTNPESRAFIESDKGVKLAAATAIVAAYANYDLDRLLSSAPKPPKVKDPKPPASTQPSATVITVGDSGTDVRAWQRDLIKLLGKGALPRFGADGKFGAETRDATNRAFRTLGLTARDASKPLVGPKSRTAMETELAKRAAAPPAPNWRGKAVVSKVNGLRFYAQPGWYPQVREAGTFDRGYKFPRIEARIAVGGGHQYRVRNSRGRGPYYVTASSKYVRLA